MPFVAREGLTFADKFLTLLAMDQVETDGRAGDARIYGEVPGTYVRLLYDFLRQQGHDPVSILEREEPQPQQLERVPIGTWRAMLQAASRQLQDEQLGLHLGQHVNPTHFGVMGYVLLACDNLGAALQRMEAFHRLLYDVNPLAVTQEGDNLALRWGSERGRPGALVDETAITALVQFARDITASSQAPVRIDFINPPPTDIAPYNAFFSCDVRFGQAATCAVFPARLLAHPLRQPDQALLALLEAQAARLLADLPVSDALDSQVRHRVAELAPEGRHSLDNVAQALNLSARTLHRRLEQHGLNFRRLRDDTLRRIAEDHLRDAHLQLADVALLLGYSEQSAFQRAFRRWTGRTPRQFRQSLSG